MNLKWFNCLTKRWSKDKIIWEYGICTVDGTTIKQKARRHKIKGNVQFILWKAGEQGHQEDYWHNFNETHWKNFKPNNP